MVCQRDCFNCGSEDNVSWREQKKEYYCDDCVEIGQSEEDEDELQEIVKEKIEKIKENKK